MFVCYINLIRLCSLHLRIGDKQTDSSADAISARKIMRGLCASIGSIIITQGLNFGNYFGRRAVIGRKPLSLRPQCVHSVANWHVHGVYRGQSALDRVSCRAVNGPQRLRRRGKRSNCERRSREFFTALSGAISQCCKNRHKNHHSDRWVVATATGKLCELSIFISRMCTVRWLRTLRNVTANQRPTVAVYSLFIKRG